MKLVNSNIICISTNEFFVNEDSLVNSLFAFGLQIFHLRQPNASKAEIRTLLSEIKPKYRSRIALHSHHELAEEFGINRLHFTEENRPNFKREEGVIYSTSFHDMETAKKEGEAFDYYFLSPIMDSISKEGYQGKQFKCPSDKAVALGGVSLETLDEVKAMGYKNIALLGTIWQEHKNAVERFLEIKEKWDKLKANSLHLPAKSQQLIINNQSFGGASIPQAHAMLPQDDEHNINKNLKANSQQLTAKTLTIAGFDPSGGAGILRDAAVINDFNMECLGVLTCNTIQNNTTFDSVHWLSQKEIEAQIEILKEENVVVVKIGLTKDLEMIQFILNIVKANFPKAKIVLDPILRTSSGFSMDHDANKWSEIVKQVDVLTPNWIEMQTISGKEYIEETAREWSKYTTICLKGGHSPHPEMDLLFVDGERIEVNGRKEKLISRHGSGCTYSTAFACAMANSLGYQEAAKVAKNKTEEYLMEGSSEEQPKHRPLQYSLRKTDNN